jgi:hypothetical protein
MTTLLVARTPLELARVTDLIHDCWFDADKIDFRPEQALLTIPFVLPVPERGAILINLGALSKIRVPYVQSFVEIHNAAGYRLIDDNRIGRYDFNEIRYLEDRCLVTVMTGIPITLEVEVTSLEVAVAATNEVIEERAQWQIGSRRGLSS